jgi:hypothetical protein
MADLSARTPVRALSADEIERMLAEHQLYLETEYHQGHRANFSFKPQRLAAASVYGSAPMLNWLVEEKQITPHIPVIDKSKREEPSS